MANDHNKSVLLFAPQPNEDGRRVLPLGLLAISAVLDKQGYNIKIIHSYDEKDCLKAIESIDQMVAVGITAITGYQIYDGLRFAKLVREKNPNIPIIWGGVHSTILPEQTVSHSLVDIVVRGAGEETFTELIDCLASGSSYSNVKGITYQKENKIINNPDRPYKSINEFPSFPYHILGDDIEKYFKQSFYAKKMLPYITSTGCPFRCTFCHLSKGTSVWDSYPPERVVDEIDHLVKTYNIDGIELRDYNFFVDVRRVREICHGLIDRGINISITGANGRAEQMVKYFDDDWRLLQKAGFKEILIGAESGDQKILDLINKQGVVNDVLECAKKAKQFDINAINSFMTSFPALDTLKLSTKYISQELNHTVDLIAEIFKVNQVADSLIFLYTPYPGTPLYDSAVKNGYQNPQSLEDWSRVDFSHKSTPWTTKSHMKKVLLLKKLVVLKKIISPEYVKSKHSKVHTLISRLGLYQLLNLWIDIRLKYKFYYLPFERLLLN
jgi:anaerobic magnesium-protoporphyrin IX monomethyl ester cyclase